MPDRRHHSAEGPGQETVKLTDRASIMSGSWGCPHELNNLCTKVNQLPCDPGMKGCVLYGRFVFANEEKNERLRQKQARGDSSAASPDTGASRDAGE